MIICTLSVILIILTVLTIALAIGMQDIFPLIIGGFFIGAFGWGIIGNAFAIYYISRPVTCQIIKTDSSIILIKDGQPVETLTEISNYKKFSNLTNAVIYQRGGINMYRSTNWFDSYTSKKE